MMAAVLSAILAIAALTTHPLPRGTQLHIRLTTTVGSYASVLGSPVSAVLIAPLAIDGETVLEAGSTLSGMVKAVTKVGFGVRHETAGLDLEFNKLAPLDGGAMPISARVTQVDNSRERVTQDGSIQGVRSTGSLSYRVSGYIRALLQWELHAELAEWVIRSFIMELPEPEIYYPAGVEMTVTLTRPLSVESPFNYGLQAPSQLNQDQREELAGDVAAMPYRTQAPKSGDWSDPTHVLFIGSHRLRLRSWPPAGRRRIPGRCVAALAGSGQRGNSGAMLPRPCPCCC
jgi:hypothetical protein